MSGKSKIGDFIRKLDYQKAKGAGEYKKSSEDPYIKLKDLKDECMHNAMSFEDFKVLLSITTICPYNTV